ncbi:hypothetical protein KY345_01795, partial [Candidatus Woesearchaeota archaeon]|nr:hypothetical protein [Candidatus Woesearchaeota archaeon]
ITPDPAYDTSTLTGDGNYSDPDNDPSASTFRWFANGVEIPGETSQSLASAYLNAGDIITFEYTPNDGTAAGTPLNASITINLDPAPGITIHSPLPGSVHASSALLNVSTNETADCLYSLNGAANQTLYTAATEGSANAAPLQHGNNTIDVVCSDLFGKSSSESVIFEGDIIAPAAITDLSAAAIDDFSIELTWTAVGDDGVTGTASSYIIKQAYAPITTQAQFDAASTAVGSHLITPAASGSAETFIVTGLVPGSTYHFAVEAVDDVGHVGALGNTDSATPSTHDVSVNSFAHDKPGTTLYVGDSITFTANIGNSGNIAETITVDLAENGAVIDTQTINLTSGANQDVTFNYVLPAESLGTRYSVEASISEVDIDGSNNYMQLFIDTWSIRNNFNLDWVDPSNYPNANEAGATFYAWAKLENTKVYDFNNVTITVNTDGLSINTNQDGTTDNLKTYSPFEGYDINTFWWEINSGSSETRDITVSIGNPGDDITITRSVTFP